MTPANFQIGLRVSGKRGGLETEPAGEMEIPDSPRREIGNPAELTTIYQSGADRIEAKTTAGNGVDISSPTTFLQHKRDEEIVDTHLVQGNVVGYSEFTLTDGNGLVVRSERTES